MDPFLRRVVEQRLLEQEADILATAPATIINRCRVCGGRMPEFTAYRVCTQCGGKTTHNQLEREDARGAYLNQLVGLAGIQPVPKGETMAEKRKCAKCGADLHWKNKGDECPSCRPAEEGGAVDSETPKRRQKSDIVKRFRVVAVALGVDPDKLLAEFCEGWLERIRSSAKFGSDA